MDVNGNLESKSEAKLRDRFIDHPINASGGLPIQDSDEESSEINLKFLKNYLEIEILKIERKKFFDQHWLQFERVICGIVSLNIWYSVQYFQSVDTNMFDETTYENA